MKSTGSRIEPWGTPHVMLDNPVFQVLLSLIYSVYYSRFDT